MTPEQRERILAAIDAEPELPGTPDLRLVEAVRSEPETVLRATVTVTKRGIRERVACVLALIDADEAADSEADSEVDALTPAPDPIAEALAKIERAFQEVYRICRSPRDDGWRMSVPVRLDRDSDILIGDGLDAAKGLVELARDGLRWRAQHPPRYSIDSDDPFREAIQEILNFMRSEEGTEIKFLTTGSPYERGLCEKQIRFLDKAGYLQPGHGWQEGGDTYYAVRSAKPTTI